MYIDVDNHKTYIATGSKEHIDGNMGMTFIHGTAMDHTVSVSYTHLTLPTT